MPGAFKKNNMKEKDDFSRLVKAAEAILSLYTIEISNEKIYLEASLPKQYREVIRELRAALRDPHGWEARGIVTLVEPEK